MGTEKAAHQTDTHAKKRANSFMAIFGVAADISAVAALIFNKDLALFVQVASVAGVAVGVYQLLRQWGKPVGPRVVFAAVCIAVGCVVGTLSLVDGARPAATQGGNSPNGVQQTGSSGSSASPNSSGGTFQFRLEPRQGIDLDTAKHAQGDVVDTDGPNGNIDVFMTQFGYLVVNNGSFYTDTGGPDSEIQSRCTKALITQRDPEPQVLPQKGVPVCFKTSAGKMGWLRTNDSAFTGQVYAVLNAQIW